MTRELPPDCARRYSVVELIGEGAYGEVYKATQLGLDRPVALKVLRAGRSDEPEEVQRFLAEARITAGLSHPGIVIVIDFGHEDGFPWIAYEFLPGPSLAKLGGGAPMDPGRVMQAGIQIAQALEHAHHREVLHRDVKPDNVVEVERDRYKVGDFGIAKWSGAGEVRTRTGLVIGSPAYLAPEIIAGQQASPASDVYALAVSLYELVAGEQPFQGSNIMDVLQGHLRGDAPPLSRFAPAVPSQLQSVIARGMAREPEHRFATAAAMSRALEECAESSAARPGERAPRTRRQSHSSGTTMIESAAVPRPALRPRVLLLAGLMSALAVGISLAVALRLGLPPVASRVLVERITYPEPGRMDVLLQGAVPADLDGTLRISPGPGLPAEDVPGQLDRAGGRLTFTGLAAGRRGRASLRTAKREVSEFGIATPRPVRLANVDWLSDQGSVMVYFRCATVVPAVVELWDPGGKLAGRKEINAGERDFYHRFTGLVVRRGYQLRVRPQHGWGGVIEVPVRTQSGKSLSEQSRKALAREGAAMDSVSREMVGALSGEAGSDSAVLMFWRLKQLMKLLVHLIHPDRRLFSAAPPLKMIAHTPNITLEDVQAVSEVVTANHDGRLLEALDARLKEGPIELRPYLLDPALQCRFPAAEALARETLGSTASHAVLYHGIALIVLARGLPASPASAERMADLLEASKPHVSLELARALVELDGDVMRERFRHWLGGRPDLSMLAIAGLTMLGEDEDVAPLAQVVERGAAAPIRSAAAMRMLAELGTPAARRLVGRGLVTNPTSVNALWCAGRVGAVAERALVERVLATGPEDARRAAAAALGNLSDPAAGAALIRAMSDADPGVRRNAAWALGQLAHQPAREVLRQHALSGDDVTGVGAWALARLEDWASGVALTKLLEDLIAHPPPEPARARAAVVAWALRRLGEPAARPLLERLATGSPSDLLTACAAAEPQPSPPGAVVVTHFPFIVLQRTGVRVKAGQRVTVRVSGQWSVDGDTLRATYEWCFPKSGWSPLHQGLLIGAGPHVLEKFPRTFLASRDQELGLTTTPLNEYQDLTQTDTQSMRGISFVQLAIEGPPPEP